MIKAAETAWAITEEEPDWFGTFVEEPTITRLGDWVERDFIIDTQDTMQRIRLGLRVNTELPRFWQPVNTWDDKIGVRPNVRSQKNLIREMRDEYHKHLDWHEGKYKITYVFSRIAISSVYYQDSHIISYPTRLLWDFNKREQKRILKLEQTKLASMVSALKFPALTEHEIAENVYHLAKIGDLPCLEYREKSVLSRVFG